MGEKYILSFMSNMGNNRILNNISNIMYNDGWTYNEKKQGKYSYWIDGPIWNFGDSKEIVESKIVEGKTVNNLNQIIVDISKYFSQSICLNKDYGNEVITATISIIESSADIYWKEISITFELNDLINPLIDLQMIIKEIKNIFIAISYKIKPFYAITGIEIKGLVDTPNQLIISKETLGDFNYFTNICSKNHFQEVLEHNFEILDVNDIGKFIFTTNKIGYSY